MADSAVSFVVGRLAEFAVKEAAVLKEVGSDVVLLKDKLQWLHTFVQQEDHRRRRGAIPYMEVWVKQTREVALEVEDVLDEFMFRVDLYQGLPIWTKCLKLLSACATQISVRHHLSARISMIKARLDQISSHRHEYIANPNATYASSLATRPSSSISTIDGWNEQIRVFGFDKYRASLEDLLVKGVKSRLVVAIVGESGIGKSTLARKVYNTPTVKQHFVARAWLDLPSCITEADMVHLIYKRLHLGGEAASTMEEIHDSLSKHLNEMRYLIVVDGNVKTFNWSSVLDALPNNDVGSRVVIINTLEDNGVALAGLSPSLLRVRRLMQADSRSMFLRNACGNEQEHHNKYCGSTVRSKSEYNKEIETACTDMLDITKGLPLAILLLGRLLRRKEFPIQWTDVLTHLKNMDKGTSRLEGILALSFDDLPHYLKSCFLYFAMMPENSIQIARRLVRLWAAEGFLKPKKGESMEDIGDRYLKELVSRGMVRLVGKASEGDNCPLVTVHRRLHAMARFEAQEATFLDVYDKAHVPSTTSIRHLFLQNFRDAYVHHMGTSFPNLRSFVCDFADDGGNKQNDEETPHGAGGGINNNQSNHRNCLCLTWRSNGGFNSDQCNHNHCLSLPWRANGGINSDQCNHNHCFSFPWRSKGGVNSDQCNHNHCLSFPWRSNGGINSDQRNHNHCLSLPWRSSGGINNDEQHKHNHFLSILRRSKLLRVIDLKGLQVSKVPPEFGNFIHLRYLAIRSRGLEELPRTIANLINLQTLDIRGCKVKELTQEFWMIPTLQYILADNLLLPKSVGKLKNMQGLIGMKCVHPWRNNITPLDNMVNLRHLHMFELTTHHFRVLSEALIKLESLVYLNLGSSSKAGIPFTLFTGFILRRLQSLKISGRIDMTGDKADKRCTLPNLTSLELVDSMVNQGFINKIGKLPCLTELVLSKGSYNDEVLSFSGGEFASLTNLVLRGLSQVSEWNIRSKSSLPRVQKITVSGCTRMKLKIEGQHEALQINVWEFMVIDMPENWPWVEGSTGLDERLKRVIVRRKGPERRGS